MKDETEEKLPQLIRSLMNPECYDHPVEKISLLQTHISWVILTGPFAYKIKKPVSLGFVDFSTLEKRQYYCAEELRLNQRFAPELYLEVMPLTGTATEPTWNGEGEPIEYAVKMVQFPEEALLSRPTNTKSISPEQVDQFAQDVALFHQHAPVAKTGDSFGTPERIVEVARANFLHLRSMPDIPEEMKRRLQNLNEQNERQCERLKPIFEKRRLSGFVRECHGDMHLGNMIFLDGKISLFDCIEFNEHFRWIDVLDEVAFCVMDWEFRGRPDLAGRFLNAYLENSGDYEGLEVFPFYLSYRAMVRAKVAAIRTQQTPLESEARSSILKECADYLTLAEHDAESSSPVLIITHGFSGSGKSWGTLQLVEELGAVRIRSDVERKRLFGMKSLEKSDAGSGEDIYSPAATRLTYTRLENLAKSVLKARFSVIVDATFLKRENRELFKNLARQLGVPLVILDFQTPVSILRERVLKRHRDQSDASEADLAVLENQLKSAEPFTESELQYVVALKEGCCDNGESFVEAIKRKRG